MRKKNKVNELGRLKSHRDMMLRNMATSLFRHERITTTVAKGKVLKSFAEPLITRAKTDDLASRRQVARYISDKEILKKLFAEIGPRYVARKGGYLRLLKTERRSGDAAEMALVELV